MREFCKVLRDMVHDGKSDDDINSTINDMTEQVRTAHLVREHLSPHYDRMSTVSLIQSLIHWVRSRFAMTKV